MYGSTELFYVTERLHLLDKKAVKILVLITDYRISSNSKPKGYKSKNINISNNYMGAILGTDCDFFVKTDFFYLFSFHNTRALNEVTLAPLPTSSHLP